MIIYSIRGIYKCYGTMHWNHSTGKVTFCSYKPMQDIEVIELNIKDITQIEA